MKLFQLNLNKKSESFKSINYYQFFRSMFFWNRPDLSFSYSKMRALLSLGREKMSVENKAGGYNQQISRTWILLKMFLKGWKLLFFSRNAFHKFSNSPTIKNFLIFLQGYLTIKVERTFLGTKIIWYSIYSKFATFTYFETFKISVRKVQPFHQKNTRIFHVLQKSY